MVWIGSIPTQGSYIKFNSPACGPHQWKEAGPQRLWPHPWMNLWMDSYFNGIIEKWWELGGGGALFEQVSHLRDVSEGYVWPQVLLPPLLPGCYVVSPCTSPWCSCMVLCLDTGLKAVGPGRLTLKPRTLLQAFCHSNERLIDSQTFGWFFLFHFTSFDLPYLWLYLFYCNRYPIFSWISDLLQASLYYVQN